jgi:hypothetical protein
VRGRVDSYSASPTMDKAARILTGLEGAAEAEPAEGDGVRRED